MTRRKSKAAEADTAVPLQITIPDDVDEDSLSELIPEVNLTSLSSDDVLSIYRLLISQLVNLNSAQRERDEARADAERKDIELDQALQDKESLTNDFEASVGSVHKELQQVKQERDQLGSYSHFFQDIFIMLTSFIHTHSRGQDSLAKSNYSSFRLSTFLDFGINFPKGTRGRD